MIRELVFATNNRHKLEEVAAILGGGTRLSTPAELGITEDIPETANTLEGNALQKARYVYDRLVADRNGDGSDVAVATFADDTGLEVAALGGAPGVRSARYAADAGLGSKPGGEGTFGDNMRLLLKNLAGAGDRSARFRTVIALIIAGPDDAPGAPGEHLFEGEVRGHITEVYRGEGGFGYDPIFVPEGFTETFAEMSAEEKNAVSHRARAVEKLNQYLKTI